MIWNEAAVRELGMLHAEGWSQSRIADRMGCTKNVIVGKLRRLGLRKPPIPIKPRAVVEPVDLTDTLPPLDSLTTAPEPARVRKARPKPEQPQALPEPVVGLCGWIDGERPSWRRCDAPVWRHSAWCEDHYRRVFTTRRAIEAAA